MFSLLPRCHGLLGSQKVDLHTGLDGAADVLGHLLALISGYGTAELGRQGQDALGHHLAHFLGAVTVGELEQDDVAAVAFDEGADRGHLLAEDQVALPVTRNRPVLHLCRALRDHHHVAELTLADVARLHIGLGSSHGPARAQARVELFAQGTAALDEE